MNTSFAYWQWQLHELARSLWRMPRSTITRFRNWQRFWASYRQYRQLAPPDQQPDFRTLHPQIHDATASTPVDPTYFYQDAWAFEKIVQQKPAWHVDVGSHHKYVSLLSKVVPVTMVDIRPLPTPLDSLTFRAGSILDLPYEDASVPSVSSLCVVEHIGLGRYGDPLDPAGSTKAVTELKRIVMPGGDLYLSIPIDDENRIYFNAHRAFREDYLLALFDPFEVVERRYIFGSEFGQTLKPGFGTGCYHLRRRRE